MFGSLPSFQMMLSFFSDSFDGVDGGEFFVGDVDRGDGGGEHGSVGVGEQEDRFFDVIDVGEARQGWSLVRWTMVFSPGMSAAVTMVNSCQGM